MEIQNLSTLKVHKLSQEQYLRELKAGNIDKYALYLTPSDDDSDKQDKLVGAQGQIVGFDENGNAVAQDAPDNGVGKNVEGTVYTIYDAEEDNEIEVTADVGSEIFNNYEENKASGSYSHAEGSGTIASGANSHAEGEGTKASGRDSHAEGKDTEASGKRSHAEGKDTVASGTNSHAEGESTFASGISSHAEGRDTTASGWCSHAEGTDTVASSDYQHVQGILNIQDKENKYAHIVGNGDLEEGLLSNAHTLDWEGNAWFAGDVYVGSNSGVNRDEGSVKLAKEPFIIEAECIYSPGIGSVLSNPRFQDSFITGEEISAAYNAGRELQLSLLVEDRHETLYFWYAEVASSSSFIGLFTEGDSHAVVAVGSNGIVEEYSPFYKVNMPMTGATSSTVGISGLVPAPEAGDENKVLRGDGTWVEGTSLVSPTKVSFTATAGQSSFTIPFNYDKLSSNLTVYFNGILLKETDNYTVNTNNDTITLAGFSAENGDIITVMGILGALGIDFSQEAINAINEIEAKVSSAKAEIDTKVTNGKAEIDAKVSAANQTIDAKVAEGIQIIDTKIDEMEVFVDQLPDDVSKLMSKNTNNVLDSGYKITLTNVTPSADGDVTTKKYVDDKVSNATSGMATQSYVSTQISSATSGMATQSYVNTQVSNATSGMATQSYVNTQISNATANIVTDVYHVGTSSPSNTKLLWIDTNSSNGNGLLKYYTNGSWKAISAIWS